MDALNKNYPQKNYLKLICKCLYYLGLGDCWYEKEERSKLHKRLYTAWMFIVNFYLTAMTANEVLANLRTDLTPQEKTDMLQFNFAHPSLVAKYVVLLFQRDRVKVLFEKMMEGERPSFPTKKEDRESVRKAIFYLASITLISYGTLALATVDAIRAHFKEGIPIRTEVVLYPTDRHTGFFNSILKFLVQFHWWCIVTNMIAVDCLSIFSMVFIQHKFKIVRMYFENMGDRIRKRKGRVSDQVLTKEYENLFVAGVKMHEETLWCAKNVQYALGNIYSVQVLESIALLVMCLVKSVSSQRNLTFLVANLSYIMCLFVLTGGYFTAAGNITNEAAEVGTSIFYSGWELVTLTPKLRTLIVVAIQRSHRPVVLTAFGILTLSHVNFISVLRSSYSFFAVMY